MIKNINDEIAKWQGLNDKEVEISRKENGENLLQGSKKSSFLRDLLANFGDPIIKVLLCALGINFLMMFKSFNIYESAGIVFAILLATVISTVSERGSELAFEKLKEESEKSECKVIRNSNVKKISSEKIVVGDIILVSAGEQIPADGIVLNGVILVDQSALTGESKEKEKRADKGEEQKKVFKGSVVFSGNAVIEVTSVGIKTYYGNLAHDLSEVKRESPLKHRLSLLATTISKLGFLAAGLVAFVSLFNAFVIDSNFQSEIILLKFSNIRFVISEILRAFTLAITVIVVAVPEGLPMMITVVLSTNMKKMLSDNVLVRKLVGIETAGSLNILFTDKTGTLTEGKLSVNEVVLGDSSNFLCTKLLKKRTIYKYFEESVRYNTDSIVSKGAAIGGNATDRALFEAFAVEKNNQKRISEKIPFESSRKYSAVKMKNGFWYIKGAAEIILKNIDSYYDCDGNVCKFENKDNIYKKLNLMTNNAIRVLAIAISKDDVTENNLPKSLTLLGLVGLKDKIRREAKSAVEEIRGAGVQLVMLTGDNKETANAIARECSIIAPNEKSISVTSEELNKFTDDQLKENLPLIRVISRALPSDKTRLIRISEEIGLVAGMTGDGINDAPALKKADVGFAMGSGTAVAKEAGDIVIMDNNFSSIVKAVLYGRTIFKSIRKFITFQLTMNLCAVGISLIGPFLGIDTPVTIMQMLWINIIMDTLGGLAFAGEPPLPEYMSEKPKERSCPIINKYMLSQIITMALFTILLFVSFFKFEVFKKFYGFYDNPIYFMTAFFALFIFSGIFNCLNARTYRINVLAKLSKNVPFIIIMGGIAIIQIMLIYFGGTLFRTIPLTVSKLASVILISSCVIPADMIRKIYVKLKKFDRGV